MKYGEVYVSKSNIDKARKCAIMIAAFAIVVILILSVIQILRLVDINKNLNGDELVSTEQAGTIKPEVIQYFNTNMKIL